MPKLGEYKYLLRTVAFVYPNEELATAGIQAGGTGFFVTVPSATDPDNFHHTYLVTNFHVAMNQERAVRINQNDGGVSVITIENWVTEPAGPDIAIAPISLDPAIHAVDALVSSSWFLTREEAVQLEIDAGDDVMMVGRFVDFDGVATNQPSVRFGHISMKDANIHQTATGYAGTSYVIDMHSRSGYSGSPVFVFRTHGSIFAKERSFVVGGHLMKCLGIHWGQFPERWEIGMERNIEEAQGLDPAEGTLITDGQYVKGLSGMTCVIPSWDILNLLSAPPLAELRVWVEEQRKSVATTRI